MSAIRGRNTKPELTIRRALHARGFRFRLHVKDLPGKPDLVFRKYSAAVFVHGCFWHGHDCHLFRWPSTRQDFWREKIGGNMSRDQRQKEAILAANWRVAVVWECALKGRNKKPVDSVADEISEWLRSDRQILEIDGDEIRSAL